MEAKQPQDRRPKSQQRQKSESEKSVDREVVSVGMDLRPVPLELGGKIWLCDPDPSPSTLNTVQVAANGFKGYSQAEDPEKALEDAHATLERSILSVLIDEDQKEEFPGSYGVFGLQGFAINWIESVSGFPTE